MSIARITSIVGSLYGLMRNALGLNVETPLGAQELSCTVAPDRRLVVLGHEPIAGFAVDHGTVADEAAMLALHTLDSTTLRTEPTFVAPGDSCTRTDDPGWRWHCIAGHGTALADWERRPLSGALEGLATSDHTHAISAVTGLQTALDGKQPTLTNAAALARITSAGVGQAPLWDGDAWPGGGGGGVFVSENGPSAMDWTTEFVSAGDTHGLIYAIGSNNGANDYANPARLAEWAPGKIATLRSSDGQYGSALDATDRLINSNTYTQDRGVGEWWAWDFGPFNCIRPNTYTIRNRDSYPNYNILRNWKLQGTNDVTEWSRTGIETSTWVDLDVRTGDTTIAGTASAWGVFTLTQPATAYRYLRIVTTGQDSSGSYYLVIAEIEVYGTVQRIPELPLNATGWLTDGSGHYWPYYASEGS